MKKLVKFAALGICLALLLSFDNCFAFRVSPAKIEGVEIPKGKTGIGVLHLRGSVINEKIKLFPTDIMMDRRGNLDFGRLEDWKYSCFSWIKLPEERLLILSKGKTKELEFKIKVPYNAKPGEYYACIMVEPTEFTLIELETGGAPIALNWMNRIAVPIIIEVPGRVRKLGGKVIDTSVDVGKEEIKILATFQNMGNVIEEVRGNAQIINKTDRKIYDVVTLKALNPSAIDGMGRVFPETLRDFEGIVKRPLPAGDYEIRVAFDYGLKVRKARARTNFSVTQELAMSLKELLTLATESEFLEFELKPGGMVIKGLGITNLDFQPLRVAISILPEKIPWLRITQTELNLKAGESRKIRFRIKIPRDEKVERSAKIVLTPERGKSITIDFIIEEVVNPKNQ